MARGLLLLLLSMWLCPAWAHRYYSPVDKSVWEVASSPFECTISHEIPYYGRAVFSQRAGEDLGFYLENTRRQSRDGKASLLMTAPEWQRGSKVRDFGLINVSTGLRPIRLDGTTARHVLLALHEGMLPLFSSVSRGKAANGDSGLEVALSPVNFQAAYRSYNTCLAQLLPLNFEQVSRTVVYFDSGQYGLTSDGRDQLDIVVRYVNNDPDVKSVLVDGYTEIGGRTSDNLALAEKRVKEVSNYLAKGGVKDEIIVKRWYGRRYALPGDNAKASGPSDVVDAKYLQRNRNNNRRVTVRLSRDVPVQDTPDSAVGNGSGDKPDQAGQTALGRQLSGQEVLAPSPPAKPANGEGAGSGPARPDATKPEGAAAAPAEGIGSPAPPPAAASAVPAER